MLLAGRFMLAPSANRKATAGLKPEGRDSALLTGDPTGFTLADTLACGTVGHITGHPQPEEHGCPVETLKSVVLRNVDVYFRARRFHRSSSDLN